MKKENRVSIRIDGSCLFNGHGGWGVVVCFKGVVRAYHGHILTNHSLTAEKMALAIALTEAPRYYYTTIYTDCTGVKKCFDTPNLKDEMDKDISLLREGKPLTEVIVVNRKLLKDAHNLARRGAKQR